MLPTVRTNEIRLEPLSHSYNCTVCPSSWNPAGSSVATFKKNFGHNATDVYICKLNAHTITFQRSKIHLAIIAIIVCCRCEIRRWFWRLLAPEGRAIFLHSLQRQAGAALCRPPSDKNHRRVSEPRRRRPQPPQPRDPGAPGHIAHPLQPSRSAASAGPGRGSAQASLRSPSASPCVPL